MPMHVKACTNSNSTDSSNIFTIYFFLIRYSIHTSSIEMFLAYDRPSWAQIKLITKPESSVIVPNLDFNSLWIS